MTHYSDKLSLPLTNETVEDSQRRDTMKIRSLRIIAVPVASVVSYLLLVATASGFLNAAEIKVLSGRALKPVMSEIIPQFERSSGHKVMIDYEPRRASLRIAFKKAKPSMWQSRPSSRLQVL